MNLDPKITVNEALELFDGNQAALARELKINRASVNAWVKQGKEYIPGLQAHRLEALYPNHFNNEVDK